VPILLTAPGVTALERLLSQARAADVTYEPVGATRVRLRRPGFITQRHERRLGDGASVSAAATEALRHWEAHRRAGARLVPEAPPLEAGATVLIAVRLLGLHVVVPCRIVYVTDDADRFGFAYGTLPGHPEAGEESFHIEERRDGVFFVINGFFRIVHPLARLGGPVSKRLQRGFTEKYLDGLAMHVRETALG
jgi:uncharacterized protein (UPF0548 family)